MSLARTALRLSAIEAMKADATIAALCGGRVFDSLIEEFDSTKPVPMIVVLTEEDGGKGWSANNGGPPFNEICELSLEIACRQVVPGSGPDDPQIATPQTDRELEAVLDLIERRALDAITVADTPQSRLVRTAVLRRVSKFSSVRFASDQTGVKLAVREVRLTCELKGDDTDAFGAAIGPFASLPDPLRTVACAMPAGSSGALTCQMIADAVAGIVPQAFNGVAVLNYVVQPPSEPPVAPLADDDPRKPDPIADTIVLAQDSRDGS